MRCIKSAKCRRHEMRPSNIFLIIIAVSLASCSPTFKTFGLKPLYPENKVHAYVDSLQPVLRWEPFPSEGMRADAEQISKIRDITYELNIWLSENDYPVSLIYVRTPKSLPGKRASQSGKDWDAGRQETS